MAADASPGQDLKLPKHIQNKEPIQLRALARGIYSCFS